MNSRRPVDRNHENVSIVKMKAAEEVLEAKQKEKPSFKLVKFLRIEKEKSYIDMSKRRIFGVLKEVA